MFPELIIQKEKEIESKLPIKYLNKKLASNQKRQLFIWKIPTRAFLTLSTPFSSRDSPKWLLCCQQFRGGFFPLKIFPASSHPANGCCWEKPRGSAGKGLKDLGSRDLHKGLCAFANLQGSLIGILGTVTLTLGPRSRLERADNFVPSQPRGSPFLFPSARLWRVLSRVIKTDGDTRR